MKMFVLNLTLLSHLCVGMCHLVLKTLYVGPIDLKNILYQ